MISRKFKFLIVFSLVILALFAVHACAIIDGGSGLSVDQLIDASRGIYRPIPGIPENPQVSRKLWSEESGVNLTLPDKLPENGTDSRQTRSSLDNGEALAFQTESTMSSGQAQTTSSPEGLSISSAEESVAGNWSFRLRDSKNRFMALTLFQLESTVLGAGNINDGGDTLKVLASGSISVDKLSLDVISSGIVNLYRLRLNLSGNSASGEYRAFSTKGETWVGTTEGMLAAS